MLRQREDFEEFYQSNYRQIVGLLLVVLGDRQEAEDAAQEAFARALARWPRVSRYDLPEAWVRRVALRIAVDSGRRLRRIARTRMRMLAARRRPVPEPGESLAFTPIGRALMRLPLREREVLVMHYLADLPAAQIAEDRGIPVGTVKARLAAGRRRLERELAGHPEGARDA